MTLVHGICCEIDAEAGADSGEWLTENRMGMSPSSGTLSLNEGTGIAVQLSLAQIVRVDFNRVARERVVTE